MSGGPESGLPSVLVLRTGAASGTRRAATVLAGHLRAGDLLVLDGPLGAGKTTFTQGLGEGLGVRGPVASPTFVIARIHPNLGDGPSLAHVDAYRLAGAFEIDDLDLETEMDRAVTVIEWGRDLVEHLQESHLRVELERPDVVEGADVDDPEEPRTLRLVPSGPRWDPASVASLAADLEHLGMHAGSDAAAPSETEPSPTSPTLPEPSPTVRPEGSTS